jgi:hypothetical protein
MGREQPQASSGGCDGDAGHEHDRMSDDHRDDDRGAG